MLVRVSLTNQIAAKTSAESKMEVDDIPMGCRDSRTRWVTKTWRRVVIFERDEIQLERSDRTSPDPNP